MGLQSLIHCLLEELFFELLQWQWIRAGICLTRHHITKLLLSLLNKFTQTKGHLLQKTPHKMGSSSCLLLSELSELGTRG